MQMARKRGKKAAPLEGPPENCSVEDMAGHQRWLLMASAIGFNFIAKDHAKDLEAKSYFRMLRDDFVRQLIEAGGNGGMSPFTEDDAILELEVPDVMPRLRFRASDIEQMRLTVARHDLAAAEKRSTDR